MATAEKWETTIESIYFGDSEIIDTTGMAMISFPSICIIIFMWFIKVFVIINVKGIHFLV